MADRAWFLQTANRHRDMIFRLAFSALRNEADAEDVTQTVLLRLYDTSKRFESEDHIKYWLIRVTINACKKQRLLYGRGTEDVDDCINRLVLEDKPYAELLEAVMGLEEKYRVAIYLHYFEGYSIKEMAKLLHLPQGTVGTRLDRARKKLREQLKEEAET